MYVFETVLGSQESKPLEVDTTSSEYVVYIRKNIKKYQETDDEGNVTFDGWKYEEAVVPNNDFLANFLRDTVATNDAIMEGLVDIYEMQLGEV